MITAGTPKSRRDFLVLSTAAVGALVLGPQQGWTAESKVDDLIKQLVGDRKMSEGRISLDLPSSAENGMVVPLNFDVESPMTADDYVSSVHFYAEGNPNPLVADYKFTPLSPKAAAQIRIRLAKTQNVVAVAVMSNGEVFTSKKEVKVTIGGCGG